MDITGIILEFVVAHWPAILIGCAAVFVIVAVIARTQRKTRVNPIAHDVLDEGADRAARNQALIDAPPAAAARTRSAAPSPQIEEAQPALAPSSPQSPPAGAPAASSRGDDLTQIKGLGPKLAATLRELGVSTLSQIAAWDEAEIARIDARLGRFKGRIARDNWVEQAQHLTRANGEEFASKYGNNG